MPIYWEKSVGGVQYANFDIEEDNERCQLPKPQMKNDEDKEQITNPTVTQSLFLISKRKIIATIRDLGCRNL
jgi:hypothetical protein